jgi:hypothetical protein
MITFESFFVSHCFNEGTRRNFIKQVAGAVTSAIAAPATKAATVVSSIPNPNFGYDVSNAVEVSSLTELFSELWKNKKYTPQQLMQHSKKTHDFLKAAKVIDARTAKMLLAFDVANTSKMTAMFQANRATKLGKQMGLNDSQIQELVSNYFNEDAVMEDHLDMLIEFLATGDQEIFNHLMPLDVKIDGKVVMTKKQAIEQGVFKPLKALQTAADERIRKDIDRMKQNSMRDDDIEYSPMDYKGGWENDPDTQPLSWESFIAEKSIHDPVRPGILKRQVKGKMTCSKARSLKSKQKNKGNNTAKAAQRFCNYRGCKC